MEKKYIDKAKEVLEINELLKVSNELVKVLNSENEEQKRYSEMAKKTRNNRFGNKLYIRGSLEYSNICSNYCAFCGMSIRNTVLKRYTLNFEEAKNAINRIKECRIKQLHLVSGEYIDLDLDAICSIVSYAKDIGLEITLVLGEIKRQDAEKLFKAGARRYICKFETSNPVLFSKYKGGKNLINRIANLYMLRDIGFKIGTGIILGLPGTTFEDLINDLSVIKNISPDMASISIFKSNPYSDMANMQDGSKELGLNFLTLMRLILDNTPIITCSSSFGLRDQVKALNAGANLMTMHVTPKRVAEEFSMYTYGNRVMTQYEHIINCSKLADMEITEYE